MNPTRSPFYSAASHDVGFDTAPVRKRAAIYVRRSVQSEGGKSKSLNEQVSECTYVCQMFGYELDPKLVFIEQEGKKGDWWWSGSGHPGPYRPELGKLVESLENREVDVLVVWRSDRIYRDAGIADALLKLMRENNVALVASRHDFAIHTATGFANASSEAVRNREVRDKISEDIRRDLGFKSSMRQITGRTAFLGFRSAGAGTGDVITVPEEIALVQRIFRLFVYGESGSGPMSLNGIAWKLISEGVKIVVIRSLKRREDYIAASSINSILNNPAYIGKARFRGQLCDRDAFLIDKPDQSGMKETVIPLNLWESAQERRQRSTKYDHKLPWDQRVSHLLTGLMVCGRCGSNLYVMRRESVRKDGTSRSRSWFHCCNRMNQNPCSGVGHNANERTVETWLFDQVAPLMIAEVTRLQEHDEDGSEAKLAILTRQLTENQERERTKLRTLLDVLDARQFAELAAQLRSEREVLERQIDKLKAQMRQNCVSLTPSVEEMQAMPRATLRATFQQVIEWIAMCNQGVIVHTRWGSYISGAFRKGEHARGENPSSLLIEDAHLDHAANCLSWLSEPETFVNERRRVMKSRALMLTNEEILPGYEVLVKGQTPYSPEIEVEATLFDTTDCNSGDHTY